MFFSLLDISLCVGYQPPNQGLFSWSTREANGAVRVHMPVFKFYSVSFTVDKANESIPGCHHTPPWTQITLQFGLVQIPLINTQEGASVHSFTDFRHYKRSLWELLHISNVCLNPLSLSASHLSYIKCFPWVPFEKGYLNDLN